MRLSTLDSLPLTLKRVGASYKQVHRNFLTYDTRRISYMGKHYYKCLATEEVETKPERRATMRALL